MRILGLDVGTNSVGSAWVDTEKESVFAAVGVFPAGVDQTTDERGAPKNQERRENRQQRKTLFRRGQRKRRLRELLTTHGLLPSDHLALLEVINWNPWLLRQQGLERALEPYEFGRVLLHLCQRRGAVGIEIDAPSDKEDGKANSQKTTDDTGKVKDGLIRTEKAMKAAGAKTFGEFMFIKSQERRHVICTKDDQPRKGPNNGQSEYSDPIRNRRESHEFHAHRRLIQDEFGTLWKKQEKFKNDLSAILTDDLRLQLHDDSKDDLYRNKGLLFRQRKATWDVGTLGRCDLEPSDRCVPIADMYASQYRVLETVNNIRVRMSRSGEFIPLDDDQRAAIIELLTTGKTTTVNEIKKSLGIDKRTLKKEGIPESECALNLDHDETKEINSDWFYRAIVIPLGEQRWKSWNDRQRDGVNKLLLRLDPANDPDIDHLRQTALKYWGLDEDAASTLVENWKSRPKLEKRLNLSRRAIQNLMPYMSGQTEKGTWPTQIEARQMFAEDASNAATDLERKRYALGTGVLTKKERHYLQKHTDELLPPPMMSNPVVRKSIYEVRRHVMAHINEHGCTPDRVVIEFAREAHKTKRASDRIYNLNKARRDIRKSIVDEILKPAYGGVFRQLSHNQIRRATDRVVLVRQQNNRCPYTSGVTITDRIAALGDDVEIDHIIPRSRMQGNPMNGLVLCMRDSNRQKGNRTLKEWWGTTFNDEIQSMAFMGDAKGTRFCKGYFTKRDYAQKWTYMTADRLPDEWRGSQLSDTGYVARQVQEYLQKALWPNEPSHLAGGKRRIFITKGAYTSQLRKDWQLYHRLIRPKEAGEQISREQVEQAAVKNRGDHREHAVDAVVIAFTSTERMQDLAKAIRDVEEAKEAAQRSGVRWPRRKPLDPPWGDVASFRKQILGQIYGNLDNIDPGNTQIAVGKGLVVSHRPVGKKVAGKLHKDDLYGAVDEKKALYRKKIDIEMLKPAHLAMPQPETDEQAIHRLKEYYKDNEQRLSNKEARDKAKNEIEEPSFNRRLVDPPPGTGGLVRDRHIRALLRQMLNQRLEGEKDANSFTKSDIKATLKKDGPFRITKRKDGVSQSRDIGVPIKRVTLVRTIKKPVRVCRERWDAESQAWSSSDENGESKPRFYIGRNNHHIEIREDDKGTWKAHIVTLFEATKRLPPASDGIIDRSYNVKKGGHFVLSLSEGETFHMRHPTTNEPGYFVVFKIDSQIHLQNHWDARKDQGEKDDDGNITPGSKRQDIAVGVTILQKLAPPGESTPIKVNVDALGRVHKVAPWTAPTVPIAQLHPRVVAISQEAIEHRCSNTKSSVTKGKIKPGSWTWMEQELAQEGLTELTPQLSLAMRALQLNDSESKEKTIIETKGHAQTHH